MKYAISHSECHTIGAEWEGLNQLISFMFLPDAPPNIQSKFDTAVRLRGFLMAARMSEMMQKTGIDDSVLIIGSKHRAEFERIIELFGANIVFHDTTL
jgi:hypothetical protein